MIVCATPRSGGTVFGYDKAKELGVPFLNELVGANLEPFQFRPTWKNKFHELPSQPIFTVDQFFNHLQNAKHGSNVILVNGTNSHWMFDSAQWFVARQNIKEWLYSVCNFWIKNGHAGDTSTGIIQSLLPFTIENAYLLYTYCERNEKQIHWYEDMYYRKNDYRYLFNHSGSKKIISSIEQLVDQTKILDTHSGLSYN